MLHIWWWTDRQRATFRGYKFLKPSHELDIHYIFLSPHKPLIRNHITDVSLLAPFAKNKHPSSGRSGNIYFRTAREIIDTSCRFFSDWPPDKTCPSVKMKRMSIITGVGWFRAAQGGNEIGWFDEWRFYWCGGDVNLKKRFECALWIQRLFGMPPGEKSHVCGIFWRLCDWPNLNPLCTQREETEGKMMQLALVSGSITDGGCGGGNVKRRWKIRCKCQVCWHRQNLNKTCGPKIFDVILCGQLNNYNLLLASINNRYVFSIKNFWQIFFIVM